MPTDTLWMIVAVLAVFGFFMTSVIWADMTWRPKRIAPAPRSASDKEQ